MRILGYTFFTSKADKKGLEMAEYERMALQMHENSKTVNEFINSDSVDKNRLAFIDGCRSCGASIDEAESIADDYGY